MTFFQAFIKILLIMAVLFAFILPGYLLRKKKLMGEDSLFSLSNLLIYVCQPILMVQAFAVDPVSPEKDVLLEMLFTFLLSFVSLLLTFFLARAAFRPVKEAKRRDIYSFISVFSNCGFLGIPFIDMMTGGDKRAIMLVAVYNVAFNVLVWTLGVYLMTQNKKDISWKHAFLNPAMIGSYVGIFLFLLPSVNIFAMPALKELQKFPVYLSNMTSVMSMFIVGVRLADLPLKSVFTSPWAYLASGIRLVISPLLTMGILFSLRLVLPLSNTVILALTVASAMSPASSAVAYAEKFGGDKNCAATTFVLGTLLSVFTAPLILSFLTAILS